MTYVLILVVWLGPHIAVTSVEFDSKESCFLAMDVSKKLVSTLTSGSNAICVPK